MRVSWDEYFLNLCDVIKTRATCNRRQFGAVITKENQIISTGYNGAPKGCKHCLGEPCLREKLNIPSGQMHEICKGTHAEQNAIVQAAYSGTSTKDATIYVNGQPCSICSRLIINAGIKKVVFRGDYPDELGIELLREAGVRVVKLKG